MNNKHTVFCRRCGGMKDWVLGTPTPQDSEICFKDCPHSEIYLKEVKDLESNLATWKLGADEGGCL